MNRYRNAFRSFLIAGFIATGLSACGGSMMMNSDPNIIVTKAQMSTAQEVPPTDSKGKGEVTATYDTATKKLSWKGSYSDLSGPATAAQIAEARSATK